MKIICDTHALVWLALAPTRLGRRARPLLSRAQARGQLWFCDISYWEIAMLLARRRIELDTSCEEFGDLLAELCSHNVLPITPAVAAATQDPRFRHGDPADRIIGATALTQGATLVTADRNLQSITGLKCSW